MRNVSVYVGIPPPTLQTSCTHDKLEVAYENSKVWQGRVFVCSQTWFKLETLHVHLIDSQEDSFFLGRRHKAIALLQFYSRLHLFGEQSDRIVAEQLMLSQVVVLVERHGPSTKRRMAFFSLSTMTHPFSRSNFLNTLTHPTTTLV